MIKQKIAGRNVNTVSASGSVADMTTLGAILEGELSFYEQKFEGGTTANPAVLNAKKFSVGKKYLSGQRQSASVSIPHVKATKSFAEIQTAVIGQFDESFKSSTKCDYSNLFYDKKEA
ncbi:hypothetical protein SJPD1_1048 [Sulfurospirillum diekertiae]|uniref:Uncharacterized protein n=1 Tax=Sulfurospirillum diekertiae TaxID=1854492 RepID=A0A290HBT0_9BACT|nr:hypothetical protein [Sulfurospirillum diekertiae]ATB68885.1 hypothetical protein SJPD1_0771 [Sulfurospirillum diekertiae]ATB69160.1 hypothetical protein SJPD1_1048 [Sulfurospirillum diekertiae]